MSTLASHLVELFDLTLLLHPQSVGPLHQVLRAVPGLQLQVGQCLVFLAGEVCLVDLTFPFLCSFLNQEQKRKKRVKM